MPWLLDIAYLLATLLSSPVWILRLVQTGKWRTDWPGRFGRVSVRPLPPDHDRLLVHAVSVGEVNAIGALIDRLADRPKAPSIVISTTTNTGHARAVELFGGRFDVVRFPFDFSPAVRRFLSTVGPAAVICFELELWPNFTWICHRRGIPIGVINGRLSERSFRRYRLIRLIVRKSFERLAFAAVQNTDYRRRFVELGADPDRVEVTGTMKWDASTIADRVEGADELAQALGVDREKPLVVAGSTAPDEHELLVNSLPPGAQLICAPRKPEWFDQAADAMPGCTRRSIGGSAKQTMYFLLDTIGELPMAYALADVVVIGRSFGALYGSNPVEPIALGKATVIGPAASDFQETVDALLAGDGMIQTTRSELPEVLADLLDRPERRNELANKGRKVIRCNQGATARTVELIDSLMH